MKTFVKEITPKWAAQILETRNPKNRTINQATVDSYAADMRSGHWVLTHQGIALDANGDLIDGQHRLAAVISAAMPVKMLVTIGIPPSQNNGVEVVTMDVIDRHRLRGIGQQLGLSHGWSNGNRVAAIARAVALFFAPEGHHNMKVTTPQTLAILAECGNSVRAMIKLSARGSCNANSKILGATMIYHSKFQNKATAFAESYITGLGWNKGCAQKALDVWSKHNPLEMSCGKSTAVHAAAAALYYYHRNEEVQILRINQAASAWLEGLNPELRESVRKIVAQ